jgi:hypothetical protein
MRFFVRYAGYKPFLSPASSCKTKTFQIFKAKRFLDEQIVKTLLLQLMAACWTMLYETIIPFTLVVAYIAPRWLSVHMRLEFMHDIIIKYAYVILMLPVSSTYYL